MNKEQYLAEMEYLRKKITDLKKIYKDSNVKYTPGQKVYVIDKKGVKHLGFYKGSIVMHSGSIKDIICKTRKDGKQSSRQFYTYDIKKIQAV